MPSRLGWQGGITQIEITGSRRSKTARLRRAGCAGPVMTGGGTPGGQPIRRAGYTFTIFRREPDGKWRLARDANLLAGGA